MNSMLTILYLDAQRAERSRQAQTRRVRPVAANPERRSRRWF